MACASSFATLLSATYLKSSKASTIKLTTSLFRGMEKHHLYFLHISLLTLVVLMGLIIFSDIRLNVLGESHGAHLKAISIAISQLIYGVEGFAGLEQVLIVLEEIPAISSLKLETLTDYQNYNALINQKITEAAAIAPANINTNNLHGYLNDQSYLYYVTLAFSLFGLKIESLAYLWFALFLISVCIYVAKYRSNTFNLLLLLILLISVTIVVIANTGSGDQLITIYNFRFIPVLGLVPLLYACLSIADRQRHGIHWLGLFVQLIILALVMHIRGSAQWMIFALIFISLLYLFYSKKLLAKGDIKNDVLSYKTYLLFSPLVLTLLLFLTIGFLNSKVLHEEYKKDIWSTSHGMWHPLVIGLTTDPVLFNNHICSDVPLNDSLKGFSPIVCKEDNNPTLKSRVASWLFVEPRDMHGFHAAVRYLRNQGSTDNIGSNINSGRHFNLNWNKYDEVLKQVYFDIILNDPLGSFYMYAIAKPLKYIKEAFFYPIYFIKGLLASKNIFAFLFALVVIPFYLLTTFIFKKQFGNKLDAENSANNLFYFLFLIVFFFSLIPSIVFYSQYHTIADSAAVLLALCLFSPFFLVYIKNFVGNIIDNR